MPPAPQQSRSSSSDSSAASHSASAHSSSSSSPRSTATPASTVVTTTVHVPQSVSTTTSTLGASDAAPTAPNALAAPTASSIPVPAIAGGTAAGILLAILAVIGWTWWGRCIKRKAAKERKQALAVLEVRENTRKNSMTSTRPPSVQHKSAFAKFDRKVTFASSAPASAYSTLKDAPDLKTTPPDLEKSSQNPPPPPPPPPIPRPPTPVAHLRIQKKNQNKQDPAVQTPLLPPTPPPVPRRNPRRRDSAPPEATASLADPYTHHRLMHQPSNLSTASQYSTQSAPEERLSGVPASLLLALTSEGSRRSILASYLPWSRHRLSTASGNRLSEYSTGSRYSQFDDQPWEPVGFAYSGEDDQSRR